MTSWAVVTGAGSGIGRFLALEMCRRSHSVLGVGRREDALQETASIIGDAGLSGFQYVSADLANEDGRARVVEVLPDGARIGVLALVAGSYIIAPLTAITLEQWRQAFGINVDARLFLTRDLLPQLQSGARVAMMQSGTGETPRVGAVGACASMAASIMVMRCMQKELFAHDVFVSATKPGPVNTAMLQQALNADPAVFPDATTMDGLRTVAPETCGRYMAWWLTETSNEAFVREGWDLEDTSHHSMWLGHDTPYQI